MAFGPWNMLGRVVQLAGSISRLLPYFFAGGARFAPSLNIPSKFDAVCLYAYVHVSTYLSMDRSIYLSVYLPISLIHITHTYIHTDIHAYIHTYIHTDIHTYIHTDIHAYIHTDIHTGMHTYMHTYIRSTCTHPTRRHTYLHFDPGKMLFIGLRSAPVLQGIRTVALVGVWFFLQGVLMNLFLQQETKHKHVL